MMTTPPGNPGLVLFLRSLASEMHQGILTEAFADHKEHKVGEIHGPIGIVHTRPLETEKCWND